MRKALRHIEHSLVAGRQNGSNPFTPGRRGPAEIDGNVKYLAAQTNDQLALSMGLQLIVKPPQNPPLRSGVVVLDETPRDRGSEVRLLVQLNKEAAGVLKHLSLNYQNVRDLQWLKPKGHSHCDCRQRSGIGRLFCGKSADLPIPGSPYRQIRPKQHWRHPTVHKRVAIVGFGYIGVCIGAVLAEKRYQVVGIDTRPEVVDRTTRGEVEVKEPGLGDLLRDAVGRGSLTATTDYSEIAGCDVIVVTVGTPLNENMEPDMRQIVAACTEVERHLQPQQIVILKSTLPPYATERTLRPILEAGGLTAGEDFYLAFCPERLAEGNALRDFRTLPVVVGGINQESTRYVAAFWREALDVPVIEVSDARTAEMTKLADNLWIDVSIAVANDLARLCEKLEVDVLEVISSANTLKKGDHNVNILLPSMGVGGSCITKDPWFVHHLGLQFGLDLRTPVTSRSINEEMPHYTFELIERELSAVGKDLARASVAVLGLAFKSNTGDVRFTPTKKTIELLEKSGCQLKICDPWVTEADALTVTEIPLTPTIDAAIRGADCVAFLVGHDDFRRVALEEIAELTNEACVILDGRMYFSRDQIRTMQRLGLRYRGIGR